jgi:hypothetical protein
MLSRHTILAAITELERLRLIEVVRHSRGNNHASQYKLLSAVFGDLMRPALPSADSALATTPPSAKIAPPTDQFAPAPNIETRPPAPVRFSNTERSSLTLRSLEEEEEKESARTREKKKLKNR